MACKYFQFDSTEQWHIQFISDIVWPKGPCKYQCLSITSFCYSTLAVSVTAWWRHQMETLSALLVICTGNSPVTGEFPAQRPMTLSFDVFFDLPWINRWANNRESGDLIHHRAHYGVAIMELLNNWIIFFIKMCTWFIHIRRYHPFWNLSYEKLLICLLHIWLMVSPCSNARVPMPTIMADKIFPLLMD